MARRAATKLQKHESLADSAPTSAVLLSPFNAPHVPYYSKLSLSRISGFGAAIIRRACAIDAHHGRSLCCSLPMLDQIPGPSLHNQCDVMFPLYWMFSTLRNHTRHSRTKLFLRKVLDISTPIKNPISRSTIEKESVVQRPVVLGTESRSCTLLTRYERFFFVVRVSHTSLTSRVPWFCRGHHFAA